MLLPSRTNLQAADRQHVARSLGCRRRSRGSRTNLWLGSSDLESIAFDHHHRGQHCNLGAGHSVGSEGPFSHRQLRNLARGRIGVVL